MDDQDLTGIEIGNYRIISEINSGAFGSVYKAEHAHLSKRVVAIKMLHTYLGSAKEREQFVQEAQFLALLEHANILQVLDFGFRERQPYLIANYAAGGSLRDLLIKQNVVPVEKALTILGQIGQALQYAHERNIIHRDLKPENILFNAQGETLLADFGIATMLSTASVKHLTTVSGTPPYMAPEQFQGIISKEGDQYALGCIAYELVTGHLPFTAPDFLSMGFKHLTEPPPAPTQHNPQIPLATEAAILKALSKQRTERHADISAFLVAMRQPFMQPTILPNAPATVVSTLSASASAILSTPASSRTRDEWLKVGHDHYNAARYSEALLAYDKAVSLDDKYPRAHYNRGRALNELKRYEEALAACELVLSLDPKYASAYNVKANALDYLGRYEEAVVMYDLALSFDPKNSVMYNNKGNTLYRLRNYTKALVEYEKAIECNPKFARAHNNRGNTLYGLKRYEEALEACEQALRLESDFASAYNNKGNALDSLARYDEAVAAYERAVYFSPRDQVMHNNKGNTLHRLKRYEEAVAAYDEAIRLSPNYTVAYNNKGNSLYGLRRYEEALKAYEQAIRLNPNDAQTYRNKGNTLKQLGRNKEAEQDYAKARELDARS